MPAEVPSPSVTVWGQALLRTEPDEAVLLLTLTALEDARLREYDLGERTGLTREEFGARLGDDVEGWSDPHGHVVVPGAETA